jgi:hypothetical protein
MAHISVALGLTYLAGDIFVDGGNDDVVGVDHLGEMKLGDLERSS